MTVTITEKVETVISVDKKFFSIEEKEPTFTVSTDTAVYTCKSAKDAERLARQLMKKYL